MSIKEEEEEEIEEDIETKTEIPDKLEEFNKERFDGI